MKLGNRLRELRNAKGLTLRQLAVRVDVGFTYLCKIENDKLDRGHTPSDALLHKLADELDGDENELLILAERIPEPIRRRVMEQPEAFTMLAQLGDEELEELIATIGNTLVTKTGQSR